MEKLNGRSAIILRIIKRRTSIKVKDLLREAEKNDIECAKAKDVIKSLLGSGKIYQPQRGIVEVVEY